MTNEDDQSPLFAPYVPITHLYFGESPSEATVLRIGCQCPRLVELVIAAYGPDTFDNALLSVAQGCPRLSAVGLGDCEITYVQWQSYFSTELSWTVVSLEMSYQENGNILAPRSL